MSRSIIDRGSIIKPEGSVLKPDILGSATRKGNYKLLSKDAETPPYLSPNKKSQVESFNNI